PGLIFYFGGTVLHGSQDEIIDLSPACALGQEPIFGLPVAAEDFPTQTTVNVIERPLLQLYRGLQPVRLISQPFLLGGKLGDQMILLGVGLLCRLEPGLLLHGLLDESLAFGRKLGPLLLLPSKGSLIRR